MDRPPSAIGFHGTSGANAEDILSGGFRASSNEYDWLGDGVYFFQDAPMRAWDWARKFHRDDPAVVEATIRLEGCMDLLDLSWTNLLSEMYDRVLEQYKLAGRELPNQSSGARRIDRIVINYAAGFLADQGTAIKCVRGAFLEGAPVFPDSLFKDLAHIQIAVRDTIVVEDTWLEPDGGRYAIES